MLLSYKISDNNKSDFKQFHEQQINFKHQIAELKEYYTSKINKLKEFHKAELHL